MLQYVGLANKSDVVDFSSTMNSCLFHVFTLIEKSCKAITCRDGEKIDCNHFASVTAFSPLDFNFFTGNEGKNTASEISSGLPLSRSKSECHNISRPNILNTIELRTNCKRDTHKNQSKRKKIHLSSFHKMGKYSHWPFVTYRLDSIRSTASSYQRYSGRYSGKSLVSLWGENEA